MGTTTAMCGCADHEYQKRPAQVKTAAGIDQKRRTSGAARSVTLRQHALL